MGASLAKTAAGRKAERPLSRYATAPPRCGGASTAQILHRVAGGVDRGQRETGGAFSAALPRVAQARGHPVDGQVDAVADGFAVVAGAQATDQLDLQVVERVDVGQP